MFGNIKKNLIIKRSSQNQTWRLSGYRCKVLIIDVCRVNPIFIHIRKLCSIFSPRNMAESKQNLHFVFTEFKAQQGDTILYRLKNSILDSIFSPLSKNSLKLLYVVYCFTRRKGEGVMTMPQLNFYLSHLHICLNYFTSQPCESEKCGIPSTI